MTVRSGYDDRAPMVSYEEFLEADARRRGDALELGHDFTDDAGARYRVCWYAATGELTVESINPDALDLENFGQGVTAVCVAAQLDRATLERRLGPWPQIERCRPRTLARLRQQLDADD
jgi:hypothetical protein